MERSGHSPLSIASFCTSVFGTLLFFVWIVMAGTDADETLIGLTLFIQLFFSFIGTGLGLFPLFSTSKKRGFAIAGVVIGTASFVIGLGILGLGLWAISTGLSD